MIGCGCVFRNDHAERMCDDGHRLLIACNNTTDPLQCKRAGEDYKRHVTGDNCLRIWDADPPNVCECGRRCFGARCDSCRDGERYDIIRARGGI